MRCTCAAPIVAVRIGPAPARESYLHIDASSRRRGEAAREAIHPGYGFLSENADFAEACAAAGIVFVGPPPAAIRAMGSKSAAKALMDAAGVPVVPGYHGDDRRTRRGHAEAADAHRLSRADQGVGRRRRQGMRVVDIAPASLPKRAGRGARSAPAFGDDRVLLERYLDRGRATSRCRCSPTPTATSCTCSSATARCSAATRR